MRNRIASFAAVCFLTALRILFPLPAQAQGGHIIDRAQTTAGVAVPGASVRVCTEPATGTSCTPLATIYADKDLTTPLSNPTVADANGNIGITTGIYVPCGIAYHLQISGANLAQIDEPYVTPPCGGGALVNAVSQPGADFCAKVNNAGKLLPTTGGVVDATGFTMAQVCATDMFAGVTVPEKVKLPPIAITLSATQNLHSYQALVGETPSGFDLGATTVFGTKFSIATDTTAIALDGAIRGRLENLTVSCPAASVNPCVKIFNDTGADGNFWRLSSVNVLDFLGVGLQIGTGGAGGGDSSQGVIDGNWLIQGGTGNTTATGIQIASLNADQELHVSGSGHIRHVLYGLDYQWGSGGSTFDNIVFGDPTGTLSKAIRIGTGGTTNVAGPVAFRSMLDEAGVSGATQDVTHASCDINQLSPSFTLNLSFNRLHFPCAIAGNALGVSSSGNVSAYGPFTTDGTNARVVSSADQIAYSSSSFVAWSAGGVKAKGDIVVPASVATYPFYYRASAACTLSGGAEPTPWTAADKADGTCTLKYIGPYVSSPEDWQITTNSVVLHFRPKNGASTNGFCDGNGDAQLCAYGKPNGNGNAYVGNSGNGGLRLFTNSADRWIVTGSAGHLWAATDNTLDIGGGIGSSAPRNIYASTSVQAPAITALTAVQGPVVNATTGYEVNGAAAAGKILVGNGTNYVASTPTFPNASATAGKYIKSDGTNWIASTGSASGTGTCTNQVATVLSADASPTCTTVTSAYVDNSITTRPCPVVDLATQNGNIAATAACTPTVGGMYRFNCYLVVTSADAVSSTLPACQVSYTDNDTNVAHGVVSVTQTSNGNAVGVASPTSIVAGSVIINAKASTAINYATTGYLSNTGGSMKYSLHVKIEYLGP